ncbi:MAG: response regulator, partial [Proteobacteria bacterium]|nr:response regulator [Pseudomonadota bacterium]
MHHKSYRILVVDDEASNRKLLLQILQDQYDTVFAIDGRQGVELAGQFHPDLILLDIMMPGMNGYEACRKLKSDPVTGKIPIIFTTAMTETADEILGFEAGCADYITKPFSPAIVLARVKTQLALRQAAETMASQNLELIEAARIREEVESIARHDLKNPLSGIFSGIELLEFIEGLNSEQTEILDVIKTAAHKMLHMINSSLDLFKMEQNMYRLTLVDVDLIKSIRRIEKEFHSLMRAHQTTIFIENHGFPWGENQNFIIKAEDLLVYSMMANLIKNAIKYTSEGVIEVGCYVKQDMIVFF